MKVIDDIDIKPFKNDQTQFYVLNPIPNIMRIHYYLSCGLNKICYKRKNSCTLNI